MMNDYWAKAIATVRLARPHDVPGDYIDDVAYVWELRGSPDAPMWRTPDGDIVDNCNGRRCPGAERIPDTDAAETLAWFAARARGGAR